MRKINLETWPRRSHFNFFSTWDWPHFNLCAPVELTAFQPYVKAHNISFTTAVMFVITRAANDIPEFRHRIRPGEVVEHEVVHPSTTILTQEDLFTFCTVQYDPNFAVFSERTAQELACIQNQTSISNEPGSDDMLYMTAIPWVSFTSFMHPLDLLPVDSIPRFAWGKFYTEAGQIKMPLSVQGHHALMDGLHMGRFYAAIQEYFDQPQSVLAVETAAPPAR